MVSSAGYMMEQKKTHSLSWDIAASQYSNTSWRETCPARVPMAISTNIFSMFGLASDSILLAWAGVYVEPADGVELDFDQESV
jgi:hypothetical protein